MPRISCLLVRSPGHTTSRHTGLWRRVTVRRRRIAGGMPPTRCMPAWFPNASMPPSKVRDRNQVNGTECEDCRQTIKLLTEGSGDCQLRVCSKVESILSTLRDNVSSCSHFSRLYHCRSFTGAGCTNWVKDWVVGQPGTSRLRTNWRLPLHRWVCRDSKVSSIWTVCPAVWQAHAIFTRRHREHSEVVQSIDSYLRTLT